jgi:uncharacterized protein
VIETANAEKEFAQDAWIGQIVAIGDAVRLSIAGPCARCVMTTLPQGDLPKDASRSTTAEPEGPSIRRNELTKGNP